MAKKEKQLHKQSPDLMERVRAARAYVNTRNRDTRLEVFAFMQLFHPEIDGERLHNVMCAIEDKRP